MSEGAVLVTGASGLVGRAVCDTLAAAGRPVRRAGRAAVPATGTIGVGELGPDTDWRAALDGARCVVHLAARTHVMRETATDALAEYRRVNVEGTTALAQQAVRAGVRRLVFMSSIKVNGESTAERPYAADDAPSPEDAYGISKWETEQALARIAADTGLEIVVLRPPLVYGPGVKGNFLRLMGLVARRLPLPLAAIANRRSLVYAGNLADAVVAALDHPRAAGRTCLVADGEDVSTPALVRAIAAALGVEPRLLSCPPALLRLGATLTGRRAEYSRLAGSLQVDNSAAREALGWQPRATLAQGLSKTARWYYSRSRA